MKISKSMVFKSIWGVTLAVALALSQVGGIGGCGGGGTTTDDDVDDVDDADDADDADDDEIPNPTLASEWVSNADWDSATEVTLTMVENSDGSLAFSPNTLTFTAGQPYILKIVNPTGNTQKHYFSTEGASAFVAGQNFYQAIATRKIETADAEYKAPYFKAVEMLVPGSSDRELEIYFVAVLPGTYAFYCEVAGHEALGMTGTITIESPAGSADSDFALDLEVASDFDTSLADDARLSGSDAAWTTRVDLASTMTETSSSDYSFTPATLALTEGQAYKLTLTNPAGNSSKHYFYDESDATGNFFRTVVFRKAQDSHAEIKPYYLKAVELRTPAGTNLSTDLYFVPTVSGDYENTCTVAGHKDLGMIGAIEVSDATSSASPALSSGLVSGADWDSATEVTLTMVENSDGTLAFSPNTLTFAAGQPYILKIVNPTGNTSKHYFSTEGAAAFVAGQNFYQAIATRKVQTPDAEYKAPYFKAVEMLVPTTSDRELEIYFVPQLPGTYAFYCEIAGHEDLGMTGTITIQGDPALHGLDLEVASDFNTSLTTDGRTSGSHAVWTTRTDITSTMTETSSSSYSFTPSAQALTKDAAYKLTLTNPAGNSSEHYFYNESNASGNFFRTVVFRKAQDSHAEIKPYYLKAVELRTPAGSARSTDLYIVPTVSGAYENVCTVSGHEALGMTGTITVP